MFEQDYIMRAIKDIAKMLAKIIFNKEAKSDVSELLEMEAEQETLEKLRHMIDEGEINEAENLLFELTEESENSGLPIALAFYSYLNEKDDEFLLENNYSRKEIMDGLKMLLSKNKMNELMDLFLLDT
ncbi:MAG: DUF6483 family protein [Roseburia sp.]